VLDGEAVAHAGVDIAIVRVAAILAAAVFLSACGGGSGARAVIDTGAGSVTVHVEVAETAAQRERGLMGRTSLASDAGMVFLFPTATTDAFWMKDTLIPLSIAFYGADGRILRILDMPPCHADPCPVYNPGVAYRGALEVNRGAFRRWGVREGDVLEIER
jgi:uncharacterized membrane protein (UPF0127 family)